MQKRNFKKNHPWKSSLKCWDKYRIPLNLFITWFFFHLLYTFYTIPFGIFEHWCSSYINHVNRRQTIFIQIRSFFSNSKNKMNHFIINLSVICFSSLHQFNGHFFSRYLFKSNFNWLHWYSDTIKSKHVCFFLILIHSHLNEFLIKLSFSNTNSHYFIPTLYRL